MGNRFVYALKYRVFDTKIGCFVPVDACCLYPDGSFEVRVPLLDENGDVFSYKDIDDDFDRFKFSIDTGYSDRNGISICTGDVVKYTYKGEQPLYGVIEFDERGDAIFRSVISHTTRNLLDIFVFSEIIGNIFEEDRLSKRQDFMDAVGEYLDELVLYYQKETKDKNDLEGWV